MLKYACNEPLCTSIAHILQTSVESATPDSAIGAGVLIPLQKPGKPKGPCSSLRPIVLLNSVRKILSSITLRRIPHQVEQYLPSSQSAYRPGRSTSDIVFTLRILSSLVENKQWSFNKLGIDRSKAIDTPHRNSLLELILTAAPGVPDARAMVFNAACRHIAQCSSMRTDCRRLSIWHWHTTGRLPEPCPVYVLL